MHVFIPILFGIYNELVENLSLIYRLVHTSAQSNQNLTVIGESGVPGLDVVSGKKIE
jgi:hypothetical protein